MTKLTRVALTVDGLIVALMALAFFGATATSARDAEVAWLSALLIAFSGFNIYALATAHRQGEEQWLKAEIRKAELRKRLAELKGQGNE